MSRFSLLLWTHSPVHSFYFLFQNQELEKPSLILIPLVAFSLVTHIYIYIKNIKKEVGIPLLIICSNKIIHHSLGTEVNSTNKKRKRKKKKKKKTVYGITQNV